MAKVTIHTLRKLKADGERFAALTAYDATFARLIDAAGVEVILVGDSLGMVIQGQATTLPVTMDEMVYHLRAVSRGVTHAHVVGDMPFMSYQASADEAVKNAGRLVAEGGAEAVKLEGGADFADVIRKIVRAGIPVMGHLGLTPQSVHRMGGYVVQGRGEEQAAKIVADAVALEEAGCSSIVLEGIPAELGMAITQKLSIPTIGIGAGPHCDGQVLVSYDLLGMNPEFSPRFVKRYAELHRVIGEAVARFSSEVKAGVFPAEEHSFRAAPRVVQGEAGALYGGKKAAK